CSSQQETRVRDGPERAAKPLERSIYRTEVILAWRPRRSKCVTIENPASSCARDTYRERKTVARRPRGARTSCARGVSREPGRRTLSRAATLSVDLRARSDRRRRDDQPAAPAASARRKRGRHRDADSRDA